ncbi:hypothetical protein [Bizionia myxarmorum]|uniref:hypothetical protein n=1 Tax=Bizionia myxarmorum TaxID=291186 RepID=UPI001FE7D5A7|nr:hypothetical protein [Bizionia myxarmorum]
MKTSIKFHKQKHVSAEIRSNFKIFFSLLTVAVISLTGCSSNDNSIAAVSPQADVPSAQDFANIRS